MNKRQFTSALLAIITSTINAQVAQQVPRLVVNISIDQLSSDYLEQFSPLFGPGGFHEILKNGLVYQNVSFPFTPVDRASAIATVMTGTSPFYHGIIGTGWFDKKTLRPISCVDDSAYPGIYTTELSSPRNILTSTITDELKLATKGKAIVYGIACEQDAAILSAGHAADGAVWKDNYNGGWCTSTYYMNQAPAWLSSFNSAISNSKKTDTGHTSDLTNLALFCLEHTGMGKDVIPDMLNITFNASVTDSSNKKKNSKLKKQEEDMQRSVAESTYVNLDRQLAALISGIQSKLGREHVLFFITGTGHVDVPKDEYAQYRIPTGTFYINRVANLLNLYFGALYGSDKYVKGCSGNQIYLDVELFDKKRLKYNEILSLAKSFILQCEGVRNTYTYESLLSASDSKTEQIRNGYNAVNGGHILIEVAPGWQLINEETKEYRQIDTRIVRFPLIIYGANTKAQVVQTPVSADRIAPTIAGTINIRAPNACSLTSLW